MELIHKSLDFKVRQVGEPKDRTLEFIASTAQVDRYGDIIEVAGWDLKNFKKNPVIPWGHDYSLPPVGKAVGIGVDDKALTVKVKFASPEEYGASWPTTAPSPDTIYNLCLNGYLKAVSVGFQSLEREPIQGKADDAGYKPQTGWRFLKQELYEVSIVTIPANPGALMMAVQKGVIPEAEAAKFAAPPEPEENDTVLRLAEINPRLEDLGLAVLTPAGDYLETLTALCDLVDAERIMAADVVAELKELIPEQVIKAGAVLSAKNKQALVNAQAMIQQVLDAAEAGAAGVGKEQGKGSYYSLALSPGFDPEGGRRAGEVPIGVSAAIKKFMQS
jgi:HK97 family phage prohead protease